MSKRNTILITGSSGLIGSEVVQYFCDLGWTVFGFDNNQREKFFGINGSTRVNQARLENTNKSFNHIEVDIRDRNRVQSLIEQIRPNVLVNAAAQPSHDLAAQIPFDDFDTNAVGTINLLEACRNHAFEVSFIHMSTNKVYGDGPNFLPNIELATRYDFADKKDKKGINENFKIDQCKHSLFGASKLAADILVQEYGRYFGMKTCCLRGGCLTGPSHAGVELHGFLSYLIKCNLHEKQYTIFGYQGKQVRDNIHANDVARFIHEFVKAPRSGEVYNIGGGSANTISILEAFSLIESLSGKKMIYEYDETARKGDHIVYYSDLSKLKLHYPDWKITKNNDHIFEEIFRAWKNYS